MKKYIDYIFWKRTWFRLLFILLLGWIPIVGVMIWYISPQYLPVLVNSKLVRNIICVIIICLFGCAAHDNSDLDNPPNPFS